MYQIGDRVLYSSHGVCQIVSTQERVIDRRRIEYFVLEPIGQPGCQFLIPSGNPAVLAKLRPLLTKDELDAMLHSEEVHQDFWISDENARKLRYKELISSADRTAILGMVYTLNLHKKLLLAIFSKILYTVDRLMKGMFTDCFKDCVLTASNDCGSDSYTPPQKKGRRSHKRKGGECISDGTGRPARTQYTIGVN